MEFERVTGPEGIYLLAHWVENMQVGATARILDLDDDFPREPETIESRLAELGLTVEVSRADKGLGPAKSFWVTRHPLGSKAWKACREGNDHTPRELGRPGADEPIAEADIQDAVRFAMNGHASGLVRSDRLSERIWFYLENL